MICSECGKNEATVHSVMYINGVKTEKHLCAECAAKDKISMDMFSPTEFFKGMFDFGSVKPDLVCSNCGTTLRNFRSSGKLGCSECYSAFKDEIIPVLTSCHGNSTHKGDIPIDAGEASKKRRQIEEIKEQIAKAVADENYEEAARLRDEMAKLKEDQQ